MPSLYADQSQEWTPATPCQECGGDWAHNPGCSAYVQTGLYQPTVPAEWIHPKPPECPTCGETIQGYGIWKKTYSAVGAGPTFAEFEQFCCVECSMGA